MKLWTILLTVFWMSTALSFHTSDFNKVVYGEDNRLDVFESTNVLYLQLSLSTAAQIADKSLNQREDGTIMISGRTLESRGICADARFAQQVTPANCSGFLVGEDLLVTAGHCMKSEKDCTKWKWVFNFYQNEDGEDIVVSEEDVYGCAEIIEQTYNRFNKNDYALIRLDRKVSDREALEFRTEGKIENDVEVVVIGHPTGLPTKISDGGFVRKNYNGYYFETNLDTFGGNSGSAVFDANTGLVEGILVRGEQDYVYDDDKKCYVPKHCEMDDCRGEDVTRITNIESLMDLADN